MSQYSQQELPTYMKFSDTLQDRFSGVYLPRRVDESWWNLPHF